MKPIPVWMDCDTGTDDAVAIMLAHQLEGIDLKAISAVCGNTTQQNAWLNTRRICRLMGGRYPVYRGAEQPLTDATFVPLLQSGDRTLRRNTFETYYATLGGYRNTLAATLDAQFKQLRFFANARRYPSTLDAALDATEVPVSVYDSLIESVHANLDKMYRYVALRRRLLGVDELHIYDVYTPIVPDVAEEIPFEQAKATVRLTPPAARARTPMFCSIRPTTSTASSPSRTRWATPCTAI